ncbi:PaaX domain-containing protein, C- domain protein [Nocardioides convexus]|uniref:PaaX domain-containing protein, C- domain protein n=1 Tax=Nocardioides convexus TaxID=2712224 RepID=UPI002418B5D0|nr:PaaX domain-containing protein, C- domain protein [Nocardioides convexus]
MPVLKPVTTRSALLTLMLAAEVPSLSTREMVAAAAVVGFAEPTVRVALSRMSTAGDVVRDEDGRFRLADRLLERQRRQEQAAHPRRHAWGGEWELVVVTTAGRTAAERADLRATLTGLRLAEPARGRVDPAGQPGPHLARRGRGGVRAVHRRPPGRAGAGSRPGCGTSTAGRARRGTCSTPRTPTTPCCASPPARPRAATCSPTPCSPPRCCPTTGPARSLRAEHVAYKAWINQVRRGC